MRAVDGVSFSVDKGEIFCILGHNGAGKTTTISMLTGLFPSSSGTAIINDIDISEGMDSIRHDIGVTPQHDILWNELTAVEHLWIFTQLKGFRGEEAEVEIHHRLSKMGLWDVRDHRVKTFSGGMKRRLSVAIATIGGPSIIFMDEPSTGMDPVNRRQMWELIRDLRHEASIILTTHSMEEAQNLADRITIMAHGKMRCLGNALHLKNKFGKGYRLEIMTDMEHVDSIVRDLKAICPELLLNRCDAGNLLLDVPTTAPELIGELISYLEDRSPSSSTHPVTVREFGISHSTLEEVFLEITRRNNFSYDDDEEETAAASATDYQKIPTTEAEDYIESDRRASRPLTALLRKNLTLQRRQIGTNVCQILTPALVMLIMLALKLTIQTELGSSFDTSNTLVNTVPYGLNALGVPGANFPSQASCWQNFWFVDDTKTGRPEYMLSLATRIGCRLRNGTRRFIPGFELRSGVPAVERELYDNQEIYNSLSTWFVDRPPVNYLIPDGYFDFKQLDWKDEPKLEYIFSINDLPLKSYHRANAFTRVGYFGGMDGLVLVEGKLAAMSLMHQTYSKLLYTHASQVNAKRGQDKASPSTPLDDLFESVSTTGNSSVLHRISHFFPKQHQHGFVEDLPVPSEPSVEYETWEDQGQKRGDAVEVQFTLESLRLRFVQVMPYRGGFDLYAMLELVGTLLFPIAMSLQLPIFMYIMVMEKGGTKELMKAHGLKSSSYLISNYLFNLILFLVVTAFFWASGAALQLRLFTQTNPILLIALFFGWGNSVIAMSFLLSTFINTTRSATVIGYVIAILGSLIGILLCAGIYGFSLPYMVATAMPTAYFLVPQLAFIRGLYLMNYRCTKKGACYSGFRGSFFTNELGLCLLFLFVDTVLYLVLALYLEAVWKKSYGVSKHPLFFMGFGRKREAVQGVDLQNMKEDVDVIEERDRSRAITDEEAKEYPLIIRDLGKVFPEPASGASKVAVNGLNLVVPRGECFGLLGENGAGKTTSISIVTGLITPTSGTATVVGHDIRTDISQVHMNIGVCPQFSVLWDDLTVHEHLLFYARLKGIPANIEQVHVAHSIQQYGLDIQKHRKAKELSGGMQRRLSVAIALVGHSQIVFLDEPTTGLDPASKRQLWRIINEAKAGRAIILTTHSMEEAELLCSRIGIIAKGSMRCLGTPLHLKNKFTEGYTLRVNFDPENVEMVENHITHMFVDKTCIEVANFRGTKEFHILSKTHKLSCLFRRMVRETSNMGINTWSLSQSGLEDVFQHIVRSEK